MLDFIQLSEKVNITKFLVPEITVAQTVAQVNLRARFGMNIIAIVNGPEVFETVHPDYVFRAEDTMIVSGSQENVLRLS